MIFFNFQPLDTTISIKSDVKARKNLSFRLENKFL